MILSFDKNIEFGSRYTLKAEEGEGTDSGDGDSGDGDGSGTGEGEDEGSDDGEGDKGKSGKEGKEGKDKKAKGSLIDDDSDDADESVSSKKKKNDDKVDLLAGKYKTQEELVAGYNELTKKLREQGKLAPEKYEIKLSEGFSVEKDDPMVAKFSEIAKKHNLSNDAYNAIIEFKLAYDAENMPDYEAEKKALGPKADELLNGVSSFFRSKLNADDFAFATTIATTARGVKWLDNVRKLLGSTKLPAGSSGQPAKVTLQEAEEALAKAVKAEKEGSADAPRLRKEAERKFEQVYPEE